MHAPLKRRTLRIADLFCGAGGTSTGAVEAAEALGYHPELTAVNHWPVAVATHKENHPDARHLCTGLDAVDPRTLFEDGGLDVLWASPECTHHSVARGGRPLNDQSRATAWCVVRWAEALRPPIILVENVPEFVSWGAIGTNGRPLKTKKGATFMAWVSALESLGYRVGWRVICAANFGDPTTRRRLFVQAVRGRRRVTWPNPTHLPRNEEAADLFGARRKWRTARDHVIDWSIPGQSIYDRKRPLSEKTMRRIMAGLKKFGLKEFLVPKLGVFQQNAPARSLDQPLNTVISDGRIHLAQPFLIPQQTGEGRVRSIEEPLQTVTTESRGIGLAAPFLVRFQGDHAGRADDAARCAQDVTAPLGTITTENRYGLAEPFIVTMEHGGGVRSADRPLPTITTAKGGSMAVVDPYLVEVAHGEDAGKDSSGRRSASIDAPLSTVCGTRGSVALIEPHLLPQQSDGLLRPVSEPVPTVATAGAIALVEPFLVPNFGERTGQSPRCQSVNVPLPAVTGHGAGGLVTTDLRPVDSALGEGSSCPNCGQVTFAEHERCPCCLQPYLVELRGTEPGQVEGSARSLDDPLSPVATSGAHHAVVDPFILPYYGTGTASPVGEPLETVTTKDRFGLVRPVVVLNGRQYLLDIRFRMLQPHELAAAQGFPRGYRFTGTKTEQVKQIGNAVPRHLARAILGAALTQNSDVSWLLDSDQP